ncbi:hypothetical protein GA0004734_00035770 [Rhizobium sp. 9140]|nr:hypothetical protein GA0004734_00035770 [Rhizobium sp. 9140]
MAELTQGRVDILASLPSDSKQRAEQVNFSGAYIAGRLTFDVSPDLFFSQEAHPDVRGVLSSIHRNP